MKLRSVLPMRIAKTGYLAVSAAFCLAGLALMFFPTVSVKAIGLFFGVSMIVFGVIKLVGFYSGDLFRLAFQYDLQFGVLLVLTGLAALIRPGNMMNFICISLGICILADCLFKLRTTYEARQFGIRSWWLTLALDILAGVSGILLIFRPTQTAKALVIWLGISLLAEGILNFSVALSLVKIIKHQKPDVIDADYCG